MAEPRTVALDSKGEAHIRFTHEFEEQNNMVDATKEKTVKIIERLLAAIVELYDWNTKKINPQEPNRYEALADAIMALGQRLPVDSRYGGTLMAVNRATRVAGGQQRRLQRQIEDQVIMPLRAWVRDSYAEIVKQRTVLNQRRKEMETATRKARRPQASEKDKKKLDETTKIYDKQMRIVKKLLDKLPEVHDNHRQCMLKILDLEKEYHLSALQAIELSQTAVQQMERSRVDN